MIITSEQINTLKDHLTHTGVIGFTECDSGEPLGVEVTDLIETIEHLYQKRE